MRIYILHECVDSNDFYAEDNIVAATRSLENAKTKMFECYYNSRMSFELNEINKDETWCEETEASVVTNKNGYYRHHWKIDECEV